MFFVHDEQENKLGVSHNFLKYQNVLMKDFFVIIQKIKKNLYNLNIYLEKNLQMFY